MVKEITLEKLEEKIEEKPEILDIREPHELQQTNHKVIDDSKHIPYSELTNKLDNINYNKNIYIICRHGNSSIMACRILNAYEKSKNTTIASVKEGYQGLNETHDIPLKNIKKPIKQV